MPLKIEYVPTERLKPHPKNPNLHPTNAVLALQASLDTYNFTGPIKAQKGSDIIIGGHGLWAAAKMKGLEKVPVVFLELSDDQALAYLIADNQLAQLSHWDEKLLTGVLEDLQKQNIDLLNLGFEKDELESLVPELAHNLESFEEIINNVSRADLPMLGPPFGWCGGKARDASWIINNFPPHQCYVEPFGGAASVLLRKHRSDVEVYNDLDQWAYSFFKALRDDPRQLLTNIAFIPHSRRFYTDGLAIWKEDRLPDDIIFRCAVWYYLRHASFSGHFQSGWAHGTTRGPKQRALLRLMNIASRMRGVYIENSDFRDVIKTYDSKETLFYVDPPFVESEHYYARGKFQPEFQMQDHKDLAAILHRVKGKVALNYYEHPFIRKAYKGWRILDKETVKSAAGVFGDEKIVHRPRAKLLLLMNY